ncbi:MAG TPA: winged helix-turn-helix domain-containing protein, partial [Terriglobales bacterium]
LTTKEFALLEYLMRNAGRQITRSMIIEHVWNMNFDSNTNVVDVYVNFLRVVFETHLVSVEQLTFREFLARVPDISYLASFRVLPLGVMAAIQLDLSLAFPIIDLLLGGRGRSSTDKREVTEIEEQILEVVVQILCHELQSAWTSINVTFDFAERLSPTQMQRLMPPTDKTLCLSFEIRMPDSRGMLNVALPAVVSNQLLRTIDREGGYDSRQPSPEAMERMRAHAQDFRFLMELTTPQVKVPVATIMRMKPGDVISLAHRAEDPATVRIAGTSVFSAKPARAGAQRAAQVLELLNDSPAARQTV